MSVKKIEEKCKKEEKRRFPPEVIIFLIVLFFSLALLIWNLIDQGYVPVDLFGKKRIERVITSGNMVVSKVTEDKLYSFFVDMDKICNDIIQSSCFKEKYKPPKSLLNQECDVDNDCEEGRCLSNICSYSLPSEYPCTFNSDCTSNFCKLKNKKCQGKDRTKVPTKKGEFRVIDVPMRFRDTQKNTDGVFRLLNELSKEISQQEKYDFILNFVKYGTEKAIMLKDTNRDGIVLVNYQRCSSGSCIDYFKNNEKHKTIRLHELQAIDKKYYKFYHFLGRQVYLPSEEVCELVESSIYDTKDMVKIFIEKKAFENLLAEDIVQITMDSDGEENRKMTDNCLRDNKKNEVVRHSIKNMMVHVTAYHPDYEDQKMKKCIEDNYFKCYHPSDNKLSYTCPQVVEECSKMIPKLTKKKQERKKEDYEVCKKDIDCKSIGKGTRCQNIYTEQNRKLLVCIPIDHKWKKKEDEPTDEDGLKNPMIFHGYLEKGQNLYEESEILDVSTKDEGIWREKNLMFFINMFFFGCLIVIIGWFSFKKKIKVEKSDQRKNELAQTTLQTNVKIKKEE